MKNKYLSFIDKKITLPAAFGLLVISVPFLYVVFAFWSQCPPMCRIVLPIVFGPVFVAAIVMPFNGMMITKKGNIIFITDFRLKKFKIEELKRIALNFNERKNKKYSVTVKFLSESGNVFKVDYSVHFRNRIKGEMLATAMYTISKKNVDGIIAKTADMDIFVITIIDQNQEIVYQSLPTDLR